MIDPKTFFTALGVFMIAILLIAGFIFWIVFVFKKVFKDLKYDLKYGLFKKKVNDQEAKTLISYYERGMTVNEVKKLLLLSNFPLKKTEEICYLYRQIQRKGGKKK